MNEYLYFLVTILCFIIIGFLVYTEIRYYSSSELKFEYSVDHDIDRYVFLDLLFLIIF